MIPRRTRLPAGILGLLALVSLVACTGSDDATDGDRTTTSAPATTTTDPSFGLTSTEVVNLLAADDADLLPGEERTILASGDPGYENDPTLGYCSYPLVVEASRYDRLQVQLADGDDVGATIDATLYAPDEAEAALRELRNGEEQCPADEAVPPLDWEDEDTPARWQSAPLADDLLDDLTADRWARTVTRTPTEGEATTETVIVLRRGDAVVVVTAPDEGRALDLAAAATERLAGADSYLIEE